MMEKQLIYFHVIPLKEMALRRIAVVLVNKPDFLATAEKFPLDYSVYYRSEWLKTVTSNITDTASKLLLPVSLTSEMIPILKAVGSQITRWIICQKFYGCNLDEDFMAHAAENICWTTAGTLDYRKTSEKLILVGVFDRVLRFELACFYCLEDYVPVFWNELSEEDKRRFYDKEDPLEVEDPNLQLFLPYVLKKHLWTESVSLSTVRRDPLKFAALCGNKAATEYCLRTFPNENFFGESSLVLTALVIVTFRSEWCYERSGVPREHLSDVLRYLLSLMTPEEQLRVLKQQPREVLDFFFAWPCQDLFLDIADVIWTFLPESKYRSLLGSLHTHMLITGYYLPNIVQEFFLRSPRNFRKYFANNYLPAYLFKQFFHSEDSQTIKVVFRNLDAADRVRIVFSEDILRLFDDSLLRDGWHLVEVCIREASLSKEDRKRLRKAFAEVAPSMLDKHKRKRLFEFLDEMDASTGNKRSAEDETIIRVKKVCNDKECDTLSTN